MVAKMLDRPTLILNRDWQPVNVATVARALVLLWNEAARVVHPDDFQLYTWTDWSRIVLRDSDVFIQAVRLRLRVPEVIVLAEYDRLPSAAVSFSRRNVFKRDHWTCQYCGVQPGGEELTIDHVVPRSHGGTSTWDNCVLSCIDCNNQKADRTPALPDGVVDRIGASEATNRHPCQVGARSWFESKSGYCDASPCECEGPHGRLRSCRTRFDSSAGH